MEEGAFLMLLICVRYFTAAGIQFYHWRKDRGEDMSKPVRWRLQSVGRVFTHRGDVVITGEEKIRGSIGLTIPSGEAWWLLESLRDLESRGEIVKPAGHTEGTYLVESLSETA